jgi:hypothetical protein
MKVCRALSIALLTLAACDGGTDTSMHSEEALVSLDVAESARQEGGTQSLGRAPPVVRGASSTVPPQPPPIAGQPAMVSADTNAVPTVLPTMLIRTGHAVVQVDSLEPAITRVRQLAQQLGGFVANTTMQVGQREMRQATLQLRIPAARFDEAISGLTPVGKVESVNVTAEDVGEEFVDVSARVANARRLEERLIALLATRTGSLEDVLAVERELARVREEIERHEGRLRYLRTRAAVSTLTVNLHEPRPIIGEYPGANVMGNAFRQAWRNFVGFLAGFIASLGILVPVGLLALAAWYIFRRVWRFRRRREPRETAE